MQRVAVLLVCAFCSVTQASYLWIQPENHDALTEQLTLSIPMPSLGVGIAIVEPTEGDGLSITFGGASTSWALYRAPGVADDPFVGDGKVNILEALISGQTVPELPGWGVVEALAKSLLDRNVCYDTNVQAERLTGTTALGLRELSYQEVEYQGTLQGGDWTLDQFSSQSVTAGFYSGPRFLCGFNSWQVTLSSLSVVFEPRITGPPTPEPETVSLLLLGGVYLLQRRR